jgi:putative membrane protein
MKNLAQRFVSGQDIEHIDAAVMAAEKETAGEIVCLVVSSSYHYPMANVIGATVLALPLSLLLTPLIGGRLWMGTQNMWLFLGLFGVLFAVFYNIVQAIPGLKRRFISAKEVEEEVEEAAITSFFHYGLNRTRDATGVLLFISVLERKVWILADHGINERVPAGQWRTVVGRLTEGIQGRRATDAICEAIAIIGKILRTHFPIKPDDTNELQNVIIADE